MIDNFYLIYFLIFAFSLLVGLLATYGTRSLALKFGIGEMPDPRKVHTKFMPHMGGFGIYFGFLAGIALGMVLLPHSAPMLIKRYGGILLASVLIVAVGVYDDLKGLDASKKFLGQTLAATIIIALGCEIKRISIPFSTDLELGWLSVPITYLWLIGVSNAVNLLDGLDGLAGGVSFIAVSVFALLAWQNGNIPFLIVSLSLMGGLLGFLKFNKHPASIFMGDTGSLFLGLILAALSIRGFETAPGRIALLLPILILAIPIGDTSVAFFRRLNKGKHPFKPDKDHLHHRLIYLGLSHQQAVYLIYIAALAYGITAYFLARHAFEIGGVLLMLVLVFSVLGLKRLGYLEAQRIKTYFGDHAIIKSQPILAPLHIRRVVHRGLLLFFDLLMINLSFVATWWVRYRSGWYWPAQPMNFGDVLNPFLLSILSLGWVLLFAFNNLYNLRWDVSRFDQIRRVSKVILFGILLLFILTFDPNEPISQGRFTLALYALFMLLFVNLGRLFLIFLEKKFAVLEYAPHPTLLIGDTPKAKRLIKDIRSNPHLLYDVVGYVSKETREKTFAGLPFLGTYEKLPDLIREKKIEEIIIAINERSRDELLNLVAQIDNPAVVFKIMPQMYDAISGLRTEEILGHPLIRLFPEAMAPWQWIFKRLFDVFVSAFLLVLFLPVFLLVVILQGASGIYPPLEIINVVGKYGKVFGMVVFSTRQQKTGKRPLIGKILYSTRIYKLPALVNILMGKMSFVGPRPEPVETVEELRKKIKFYNRRFQVRPGLTGWAQVKYRYEEALKYKRDQLKHDLFYLENMSLMFDFRIILRSLFIFIFGKEAR